MLDRAEQTRKTVLTGKTTAELEGLAQSLGAPAYRGRQMAKWIYQRGATSFDTMTDLSKDLRQSLTEMADVRATNLHLRTRSSDDVDKVLIKLPDGEVIESVLLPYEDRVSICISSQVGCPMACNFCATGQGGFTRNLTAGEIVEQMLTLQGLTDRRISHIVFMGMGEPLLNLENVVKSVRIFNDEVGISMRHITVSTVGLVPQINQLADLRLQLTLAVSLHGADDEVRSNLMPVNRRWPINELFDACRRYFDLTGRRITFEYLLIQEVNDTPEQAAKLAKRLSDFPAAVNLIPFNYVETPEGYKRPSADRVRTFRQVLERAGVQVTQRVERGHDIASACGQLRGEHTGRFANRKLLLRQAVVNRP